MSRPWRSNCAVISSRSGITMVWRNFQCLDLRPTLWMQSRDAKISYSVFFNMSLKPSLKKQDFVVVLLGGGRL